MQLIRPCNFGLIKFVWSPKCKWRKIFFIWKKLAAARLAARHNIVYTRRVYTSVSGGFSDSKFSDRKFSDTIFPTANFPTHIFRRQIFRQPHFPTTSFSDGQIFRQTHLPTDKFSKKFIHTSSSNIDTCNALYLSCKHFNL